MNNHKKSWIIIGMIFLISIVVGYILFFSIPKHNASKAVDDYMKKQNISLDQIDYREIMKDWKNGGYVAKIVFKDDPKLKYEYIYDKRYDYVSHIYLNAYKDGSGQTGSEMKHPPLPPQSE